MPDLERDVFQKLPEIAELIKEYENAMKSGDEAKANELFSRYDKKWQKYLANASNDVPEIPTDVPEIPTEAMQQEVLDDLLIVDSYRKDIAKIARDIKQEGREGRVVPEWMIDSLNNQAREQEEVFLRFRTNVRKLLGFDD